MILDLIKKHINSFEIFCILEKKNLSFVTRNWSILYNRNQSLTLIALRILSSSSFEVNGILISPLCLSSAFTKTFVPK